MTELVTKRLKPSPGKVEDFNAIAPILTAEATSRFTDWPRNPTPRRTRGDVDWMAGLAKRGRDAAWGIWRKTLLIGCIRYNFIDKKTKLGVIGYELEEAS